MLYLDSSAWVKKYQRENGTDWVIGLWGTGLSLACSSVGLVEVVSAVVRRHAGQNAASRLTTEILDAVRGDFDDIACVEFSPEMRRLAVELAQRHRLRGADAIHLATALSVKAMEGTPTTFVASDAELLLAARAEGMPTLDPQENPPLPA